MARKTILTIPLLVAASLGAGVCEPTADEPTPVLLPVVADGAGIATCTNDLGWTVEVSAFRVAIEDLEFTVEGEVHASLLRRLADVAVPVARAHPGHSAGGEVTGELLGELVIDLLAEEAETLGEATLLPGDYNGLNLTFRRAGPEDGLGEGDALLGHSAVILGTATRDAVSVSFEAVLDIDPGTQMVGGPFDLVVDEDTTATLGLTAYTIDPSEGDTLFDGLDFGELDGDGDGIASIVPGDVAHNVLMKTLVRHDHWGIEVQ